LEVFVVMDKSMMGRGVFGVFSNVERATAFYEDLTPGDRNLLEVKALRVTGVCDPSTSLYVAHAYDDLYDVQVFDGIYATSYLARDASGPKGMIVEFVVDSPGTRKIIQGWRPDNL
jgi:hypothetical protein